MIYLSLTLHIYVHSDSEIHTERHFRNSERQILAIAGTTITRILWFGFKLGDIHSQLQSCQKLQSCVISGKLDQTIKGPSQASFFPQ